MMRERDRGAVLDQKQATAGCATDSGTHGARFASFTANAWEVAPALSAWPDRCRAAAGTGHLPSETVSGPLGATGRKPRRGVQTRGTPAGCGVQGWQRNGSCPAGAVEGLPA